jgi:hypothetical protein
VRRLRRLQKVPDSIELSHTVGRVQLVPFSWIMEIILYQRSRLCKNYCGFIFLVLKYFWNFLEAGTFLNCSLRNGEVPGKNGQSPKVISYDRLKWALLISTLFGWNAHHATAGF